MKSIISFILCFLVVVGNSQTSLNMSLLSNWDNDALTPTSAHNNTFNDVWGYAQDDKEYAIIGSTHGTHIIDVTDPTSPNEVQFIPGNQPSTQYGQVVHRDYHTYKNYLYMVSDEGLTNLKIADLSSLPTSAPVVYNSNALFTNSHNVFIDTTGAKLYSCGSFNQFAAYDLSDPVNPTLIYDNVASSETWSSDMGYVHDVYVRNDTAYMNAGPNGLFVADFSTNPPTFLGSLTTYPEQGYNHSGWLSPLEDVYILADENHGKDLKKIDVSDLTDMTTMTTFNNGIDPDKSIPHNVIIKDQYAYISYYFDGIYVFDISCANPTIVGYYDTSTEINNYNFRGCWGIYPYLPSGVILASDMQNGLYVLSGDNFSTVSCNPPPLEIKEVNGYNWLAYPTVIKDKLTVQYLELNSNIVITDLSGKVVQSIPSNSSNIDINFADKQSGVYFVSVFKNGVRETIKVIKE